MLALIRRFGIQTAFIAMLCACGASGGKNDKAEPSSPKEWEERVAKTGKFTAGEVLRDFQDNAVNAEIRYKDKYLFVVGVVDHVGKDILGEPYVAIGSGGKYEAVFVQCMFSKAKASSLASLRSGDVVVIYGACSGYLINVIVRDCEIANDSDLKAAEEAAKKSREEAERQRIADNKAKEDKRVADAKAAEEKRLNARTPEQKAKDEADRIAKQKEADRLAAEKAEADRLWKIKADAEAAIAKKAQDEIDAQKLYDKVTARIHLLEIIEKYPGTRAAIKAKERLDKLDKKK